MTFEYAKENYVLDIDEEYDLSKSIDNLRRNYFYCV